jgi:hypothetical protein
VSGPVQLLGTAAPHNDSTIKEIWFCLAAIEKAAGRVPTKSAS